MPGEDNLNASLARNRPPLPPQSPCRAWALTLNVQARLPLNDPSHWHMHASVRM